MSFISKTDYILWRACPKNAWLRIHKPELFSEIKLTDFEASLIDTGIEVERVARGLFPGGTIVTASKEEALEQTDSLISARVPTIFQPVFEVEQFFAAADVLCCEPTTDEWSVYEVKATTRLKQEHVYDLAFQVVLLRKHGIGVRRACVIFLNPSYVRQGEIDPRGLFETDDLTTEIEDLAETVTNEMCEAKAYLLNETEPRGSCSCIYKPRAQHCSTFHYSNPDVPEYGIHDIARIGSSPKKLKDLVDTGILSLQNIPSDIKLTKDQSNQVRVWRTGETIIDKKAIARELGELAYPLHFIDYETFAPALPLFSNYSPYEPIPLQYSLHILGAPDEAPLHRDFLHVGYDDPTLPFLGSLREHVGAFGSVIAWNKEFECHVNDAIARRLPSVRDYIIELDDRFYDLMDIFSKQYFVHRDLCGSVSIKKTLPVLTPDLSYSHLQIRDGATASFVWSKILSREIEIEESRQLHANLKDYCSLDSYGMYAIWRSLTNLIESP